MDERAIENIAHRLLTLAGSVQVSQDLGVLHGLGFAWFHNGQVYFLTAEPARSLYDLVNKYSKDQLWKRHFSDKYILDRFRTLLKIAVADGEQALGVALIELTQELGTPPKRHLVVIPITGIELNSGNLRVCDVDFVHGDAEHLQPWLLTRWPSIGESRIEEWFKVAGSQVANQVCAGTFGEGEPRRAEEQALETIRRLLELISFGWAARQFGYFGYLNDPSFAATVADYAGVGRRRDSWIISIDGAIHSRYEWQERNVPLELDKNLIRHMDRQGILELVSGDRKSVDFTTQLIDAIHWFVVAQRQPERENQLLNLITCFESLLSPKGSGNIQETVSLHLALLIGDDVTVKHRVYNRMLDLYSQRSDIAHNGRTGVTYAQIDELRHYAVQLIMKLVPWRTHLQNREDLRKQLANWTKRVQFGESVNEFVPSQAPRSLSQLLALRGLSESDFIDAFNERHGPQTEDEFEKRAFAHGTEQIVRHWLSNGNQANLIEIRRFADLLDVKPTSFLLPNSQRIVHVGGYYILLDAHELEEGTWEAKALGVDWSEATPSLARPIDPNDPKSVGLVYVSMTPRWRVIGEYRFQALSLLEERITTDIEYAMNRM